ncbi:unnamed protein product, partial [Cyprideis torosa]
MSNTPSSATAGKVALMTAPPSSAAGLTLVLVRDRTVTSNGLSLSMYFSSDFSRRTLAFLLFDWSKYSVTCLLLQLTLVVVASVIMKAVFLLVVLVGFAAAAERHVSVDDVCKWMEEHDACATIGGLNEEATAKFCEAAAERGYSIGSENCQQERIPFMER